MSAWFALLPFVLVVILATAVVILPSTRQRLFTSALLRQFRRVMPPISATEQAALEAGTTWWDAELFSGKPAREVLDLVGARLSDYRRVAGV